MLEIVALVVVQVVVLEKVVQLNVEVSSVDTEVVLELSLEGGPAGGIGVALDDAGVVGTVAR